MARRSTRKKRGIKSAGVADESKPEASSSTSASTSKGQMRKSASEPKRGSKKETRSLAKKWNNNNGTGDVVLPVPTKKLKNRRAPESASGSASSSGSGSQNSRKASTSKPSSSKSPDNKVEIGKNLYPFPTEVYELTFKELKGPHLGDLQNVSNATPEWRKLLEKDRVLFLFPKVFEILLREGFTDFLAMKNDYRVDKKDFFIYDMRLVCKSWNESIQNYLQLHPKHFNLKPFPDNDKRTFQSDGLEFGFGHIQCTYRFESTEGITEFMDKHQSTHSSADNPFFGRMVRIQQVKQQGERISEAEQIEFWDTVVNLFSTYGKHIFYFRVTFDKPMTPVKCIHFLHRVLSLLPNIKTLKIDYNHRFNNYPPITERERREIVREFAAGEILFPKFANLQILKMTDLPDVIAHHLLQKNGTLKQLKIQISHALSIRFSTMFQDVAMSRELETLHINLKTIEDIEDLQRTLGVSPSWPVKSLFIAFSLKKRRFNEAPVFSTNQWPQWNSIFRLIEHKFGESLLNLTIQLPEAELDEDKNLLRDAAASTLRLNLPHLRQLNVKLPNLSSIDFLLGMKDTLEEVTIKVTYSDKLSAVERRREKIKFNGSFEKMEGSNIWKVLPKLNKLVVEVYREDRFWTRVCRGSRDSDSYTYARTKAGGITKVNDDYDY